ncbi:MAG: hypothetical protein ACRDTA_16700, partial [Pseudonocardiaceae bacterium]
MRHRGHRAEQFDHGVLGRRCRQRLFGGEHPVPEPPPERLAAVSSRATSGTPAEIAALPEPVHTAVITGFAEAMQTA